ncbi:unnamed protein product [Meloidogyne enterolobii]|uniref:Uncharacterized protein n=1 Tax=Meloidogyne enterolobii TaxID=390850 RepID=A0ACB0ZJ38_MELEN
MEIKEKLAFRPTNSLEETINLAKEIEEIQCSLKEDKCRLHQHNLTEQALTEVNAVRAEVNAIKDKFEKNDNMNRQNWQNPRTDWRGRGYVPNRGNWRPQWNPRRNFENLGENRVRFQNNWRGSAQSRGFPGRWGQRRGAGSFNSNRIPINNPRNVESGPSTSARISALTMPYITLLVIINVLISGISAQYQICPKDKSGFSIDFPSPQECLLPPMYRTEMKNVTLFLPKLVPRYFPIYRCWLEKQTKCTKSILIYQEDLPVKGEKFSLSLESCWNLVKSTKLRRIDEFLWSVSFNNDLKYAWFGQHCVTDKHYFLEEGEGALMNKRFETSFGVSKSLDSHTRNGSFEDKEKLLSVIVWNAPSEDYIYTHYSFGPVQAEIFYKNNSINGLVKVNELQYVFAPSENISRNSEVLGVPEEAWPMDNDVFILILNKTERIIQKRQVTKKQNFRRTTTTTTTTTPIPPTIKPIKTTIRPLLTTKQPILSTTATTPIHNKRIYTTPTIDLNYHLPVQQQIKNNYLKGDRGIPGPDGRPGAPGEKGDIGYTGPRGMKGAPGEKGDMGYTGPRGSKGASGQDAVPGSKGEKGDIGIPGRPGQVGLPGIYGQKGLDGLQGPQGPVGPKGDKGSPGINGKNGLPGPKGEPGHFDGNFEIFSTLAPLNKRELIIMRKVD